MSWGEGVFKEEISTWDRVLRNSDMSEQGEQEEEQEKEEPVKGGRGHRGQDREVTGRPTSVQSKEELSIRVVLRRRELIILEVCCEKLGDHIYGCCRKDT